MNDEKEIIAALYRDGKITKAQKTALLAALDGDDAHVEARGQYEKAEKPHNDKKKVTFKVVGMENPYDASRVSTAVANIKGVRKATANITQGELIVTGDFEADAVIGAVRIVGFTCKPVGVEYLEEEEPESTSEPFDLDGVEEAAEAATAQVEADAKASEESIKKTVTEKLAGLGKKISEAVKSGLATLDEAEGQIAKYFDSVLYGEGDAIINCKAEQYDVPYEKLTATVKIVNSKGVVTFVRPCAEADILKRECAAVMNDAAFDTLVSLLENKFTGKYKYVCGGDIFKLIVKK